ncbi:carbohydrate ABC transporter permease [Poriferisphaera sp. WC338]|uniref:carbohydrate ABC transporter permease n=1 Tax=Poriferisphaera sp. WC338 TaxID=3425129 RepID=UPI003D81B5E1
MTRIEKLNLIKALGFISPWIIGFAALAVYPILSSLYWSFCDYDVLNKPVYIGVANYTDMVQDSVFWTSLWNTLVYAVFSIPLGLVLSLAIAVLLNQKVRGRSFLRTMFFLPSMVPLVAVSMIWLWMFNGEYSLINHALSYIGIEGPNWLGNPKWTKPSLILMSIWQTGGTMVIYLAALQDVPKYLYESADLDGAGAVRKLWNITIPLISPVIYFNMIMGIIGALQVFAQPYIMFGGGGPNRSALFYAVYLFENAFRDFRLGYACAMAWVLFIIIVSLTWIATRATRKHIYYAGE